MSNSEQHPESEELKSIESPESNSIAPNNQLTEDSKLTELFPESQGTDWTLGVLDLIEEIRKLACNLLNFPIDESTFTLMDESLELLRMSYETKLIEKASRVDAEISSIKLLMIDNDEVVMTLTSILTEIKSRIQKIVTTLNCDDPYAFSLEVDDDGNIYNSGESGIIGIDDAVELMRAEATIMRSQTQSAYNKIIYLTQDYNTTPPMTSDLNSIPYQNQAEVNTDDKVTSLTQELDDSPKDETVDDTDKNKTHIKLPVSKHLSLKKIIEILNKSDCPLRRSEIYDILRLELTKELCNEPDAKNKYMIKIGTLGTYINYLVKRSLITQDGNEQDKKSRKYWGWKKHNEARSNAKALHPPDASNH